MEGEPRRRRVLGAVVALAVPLAGCSGGDGGEGPTDTDADADDTPPSQTDTMTSTGTATTSSGPTTDTPAKTGTTATDAGTTPPDTTTTTSTTTTTTSTTTPTTTSGGTGGSAIDDYLVDTSNYDGTIADRTGQGQVRVAVGAEGNGGGFAYGPPAIRVDTGTTVVWEWTGGGGLHNVVAEDGTFDSGSAVSGTDVTFEHAFSEPGTHRYYCNPHKALGMKGVVVVESG